MAIRVASSSHDSAFAAASIINVLLGASTALHIRHFNSQRHSEHKVLDDFYRYLQDAADRFAEQCLGLGVLPSVPDAEEMPLDTFHGLGVQAVSGVVIDVLNTAQSGLDPVLQSTALDILGDLARHQYLLKLTVV